MANFEVDPNSGIDTIEVTVTPANQNTGIENIESTLIASNGVTSRRVELVQHGIPHTVPRMRDLTIASNEPAWEFNIVTDFPVSFANIPNFVSIMAYHVEEENTWVPIVNNQVLDLEFLENVEYFLLTVEDNLSEGVSRNAEIRLEHYIRENQKGAPYDIISFEQKPPLYSTVTVPYHITFESSLHETGADFIVVLLYLCQENHNIRFKEKYINITEGENDYSGSVLFVFPEQKDKIEAHVEVEHYAHQPVPIVDGQMLLTDDMICKITQNGRDRVCYNGNNQTNTCGEYLPGVTFDHYWTEMYPTYGKSSEADSIAFESRCGFILDCNNDDIYEKQFNVAPEQEYTLPEFQINWVCWHGYDSNDANAWAPYQWGPH